MQYASLERKARAVLDYIGKPHATYGIIALREDISRGTVYAWCRNERVLRQAARVSRASVKELKEAVKEKIRASRRNSWFFNHSE